jgi:hypothetical protein
MTVDHPSQDLSMEGAGPTPANREGLGHPSITVSTNRRSIFGQFLRLCFPSRAILVLALFCCVVAPSSLVLVHIHENPLFSPIDEPAHLDYVTRVADGGLPRLGQSLQQSTLRDVACTGIALSGLALPACSTSVLDTDHFPGNAEQYEAQQPPTYYAATVPLRWFTHDILGVADPEATRLTGVAWLVVGLLLLWAAGRLMKLRPAIIGAALLLLGTAPVVIYEAATVTNDGASILAVGLVSFVSALAWRRPGRWTLPSLAATGFVVTSLKTTDLLPVVAVSALFAIVAWTRTSEMRIGSRSDRRAFRSWWPTGGALLLGGLVSALAWVVVSRRLALVNPRHLEAFNILRSKPVTLSVIAKESLSLFAPVTDSFSAFRTSASTAPAMSPQSMNLQAITAQILQYLLLAGGVSGLFVLRRQWHHWLGLVCLPLLYIGGIALGISIWFVYHADPGVTGRYGLALAPFLAIALTAAARGKGVLVGIWLFALLNFGLDFYFMLAG